MPVIFIRHSDDSDDRTLNKHDTHITKKGIDAAAKLAKSLIKEHGHPVRVYCGPFRRTLETLESMKKSFAQPVEVVIDPRLSRYFTSKEKKSPLVSQQTINLKPPIMESWKNFQYRIKKHVRELKRKNLFNSRNITFVITHCLVLKEVAKIFGVKLPERFDFLEHFTIEKST